LDTTTYLQSSPSAEPLVRRLMAEISAVSRALGIEIDPLEPGVLDPSEAEKYAAAIGRQGRLADMLIKRVIDVGPITSSMRTDVQNMRPVEVDVRS
jgi:2-dehydropantoate 2-reductase